jgi:4-alpha-glucanotransferase
MNAERFPLFHWLNERAAGVLLHPVSLPGATGIGTFGTSARKFLDFLAEAGMKYWQVCPLGPTGFGDSPYQCFSAFAGNPYFIDLETLVEQGSLDDSDLIDLRTLPASHVDYGAQWMLRWPVLKKSYQNFAKGASPTDRKDFRRFRRQHKQWLEPYTQFIALKGYYGGASWQEWPEEPRHHSKARKQIKTFGIGEEIDAHAWFQFQFFRQWSDLKQYANSLGISVFGDIPIFVAMDSADVWTHPSLFQMNRLLRPTGVAGVPPDYFAADGQLWGNPLYDWRRHQATNYAWWLSRLKASFELCDVVRIDHFRGFDEYCRIPPDARNARVYDWSPGPGLALFEAIKEHFPEAKLVAEDLGVITETVRDLVEKCGFPGMKILQFGFEGATEYLPHNTIPNSVLYPGTHDNDTAWGWYQKSSPQVQDFFRGYLKVSGESVPWDMIRAGYASQSRLFIVPMQDLLDLGTEARMNIPGQPSGNWQWRFTSDQLENLRKTKAGYLQELGRQSRR